MTAGRDEDIDAIVKKRASVLGKVDDNLPTIALATPDASDNDALIYRRKAQQWAEPIKDPEARKMAEEAAELILRKKFELPTLNYANIKKQGSFFPVASYDFETEELIVNSNREIKKRGGLRQIGREYFNSGWNSQDNPILHELGHHIHNSIDSQAFSRKNRTVSAPTAIVEKNLSRYAATKAGEFEAEFIAGVLAGKTYPDEICNVSFTRFSEDKRAQTIFNMGSGKTLNTSNCEIKYEDMMHHLFTQEGASLRIDIVADQPMRDFIDSHAEVLDQSMRQVPMSDAMRRRLERSNWVFSGMKTFHELNEAFPSLIDKDGNRKSFEQFFNDVQKIDGTYNKNYLRAEYNFIQSSAEMAAKWEQFSEDGDHYYLQYRTAGDDKVRPEHAALNRVTLPMDDKFWEEYFPPNGWNCRCTVVQVRKSKQPSTPHDEAMALGEEATGKDSKGMFHFNPGKEERSVPKYNPYTLGKCKTCTRNKAKLAFAPSNEVCAACAIVNECYGNKEKSERAVERRHYLHEMEPLLADKIKMNADGKTLNVGFTKLGNEHLFSDTFGRTRVVTKDDLSSLNQYLKSATYLEDSELTHARKDFIDHFYYYKVQIHNEWVRLNIARRAFKGNDGRTNIQHFLYSINDIKK